MRDSSRIYGLIGRLLRIAAFASLIWISMDSFGVSDAFAQTLAQEAVQGSEVPAVAVPVVPQQVRFSGKLASRSGDTVEAVFRIYAVAEGGDPLWTEMQRVTVAEDGAYSVLLGSANANGLPQTVFAGGAARWMGVSVERGPEQERVLLSSVPYAMKSADAESLAGHAASDFVTQEQLAQFSGLSGHSAQTGVVPPVITPLSAGTITGSGTAGTIPLWTGTLTQGNSEIVQVGSDIGINEATPGATLDVGGTTLLRGTATFPALGTATTSAGYRSQLLDFTDSAWSTTTKAPVAQTWRLYVTDSANNSANPTSSFNFQFQNGAGAPTPTILSIGQTGVIAFAPAQTFPGTITSVAGTSPVTATTTSGAVTVSLDQTALVTDIAPAIATATTPTLQSSFNGVYAQLGAANTFSSSQTIQSASVISGNNNDEGAMLLVTNTGDAFSTAITASNGGKYGTGLVATAGDNGEGIQGVGTQTAGSIGVFGYLANSGGFSSSYFLLESDDGLNAGVWADGANGQESALIATSDDLTAGIFFNDSSASPTIQVLNNYSGGPTGNARAGIGSVLRASGPGGMCGINQTGNLSCTGQVKAVISTKHGARQVETYTVQSAENWVEDYGSGQLNGGSATVTVEPAFSETVNTDVEFHVFLTPGGDCKGLYVTNKTAGSFEVHELGGGTSSIPFDYKIVAKRSGMEEERLVDVTERMRSEDEMSRFKKLDRPLPRNPVAPHVHSEATRTAAAIKR